MRLSLAMLGNEARLQARTLRFRAGVAVYWALCFAPPAVLFLAQRADRTVAFGAATYVGHLLEVQPSLTVLLAVLLAGPRSSAGAAEALRLVLASAPMSNAGFVFRRWLAVGILMTATAGLPLLVALITAFAGGARGFDAFSTLAPWLLEVTLVGLAAAAGWMGLVMVTGSELAALVLGLLVTKLTLVGLNQALFSWHLTLDGGSGIFGWQRAQAWLTTAEAFLLPRFELPLSRFAVSEAPIDPRAVIEGWLPRAALGLAVSFFFLSLATAFVGRVKADLPPRPVPQDHPLRSTWKLFLRLRERYARDAALLLRDRLAVALALAILIATGAWLIGRQLHFQELAEARYRAETEGDFEPMPLSLRPVRWRIAGTVSAAGDLELVGEGRLRNDGDEAQERLAFSLDPAMAIRNLKSAGHRVELTRRWDRVLLRLTPPLAAGEAVTLDFALGGTAVDHRFPLLGPGGASFAARYELFRRPNFPRDLTDLSRASAQRRVSRRRLWLRAQDLTLVPRHTAWTLTSRDEGYSVPEEAMRLDTELEIDLRLPAHLMAADVCGTTSRSTGDGLRLRGPCRQPLATYAIFGGALELLAGAGSGMPIAALPRHRRQAEGHFDSLAAAARLTEKAWPSLAGFDGMIALEWPPDPALGARTRPGRRTPPFTLEGKVLLIAEEAMIREQPLEAEALAAEILIAKLLARREFISWQRPALGHIFESLIRQRMGQSPGATLSGREWERLRSSVPIAVWSRSDVPYRRRVAAVVADLTHRVGDENLDSAIEAYLGAEAAEAGDLEGLLMAIEERSAQRLERMYKDFFFGSALPELRLEGVDVRRQGSGYRVVGQVRNIGTGQAVCPLIARTEFGSVETVVRVEGGTSTAFALDSPWRPDSVLLDPQRRCHRWQSRAAAVFERVTLAER